MQRSTKRPSPLRLAADPPSSSLSQSECRSAPIPNRHPDHGPEKPNSPEVISSLISSLSAISTPAQSHFDNLPKVEPSTAPNSPGLRQTEFVRDDLPQQQPPPSPGFGMDYGAYRSTVEESEQDRLHPDAAAISPVIRMAKPPPPPRSPRSPFSSSRPASRGQSEDPPIPRTGSRTSLTSSTAGVHEEPSGFGVVSLEPAPRTSMASLTSTGSGGKKVSKSPLGLLKRSSRDFGKEKSSDRNNEGRRLDSSRSGVSLRSNHSMADLAEEEAGPETEEVHFLETTSFPSSSPAPNSRFQSTPDTPNFSPGGIGSGRIIPTRESSLRHNHKRPASSKRRSVRHSTYSSRDLAVEDEITEDNVEENGVSKRINEIKHQQKKIRDEMLQDNTADTSSKGQPRTPSRQREASNLPTPPLSAEATKQYARREAALKDAEDAETSAPSPTVMTRRALSSSGKRSYGPLQPKQPNSQPSIERTDSGSLNGVKRSANPPRISESRSQPRKTSGQFPQAARASPIPDERPSSADSIDFAVEDYLSAPRLTQKVSHPTTGRVIAFSEVGDPKGHVVFCCVGMGLTRFLTAFYDELARTLKLRLITPDRSGVGESEPCADGTPLSWPDDLAIICSHLKITKFSLLAHSAGAIYALATALRMPQHIRGRIHLLAPWIPPSQMTGMGTHKEPIPSGALPYSQRLLRALPTTFYKVANSSFMTATSSSITSSLPKNTRKAKRRSTVAARDAPTAAENGAPTNGHSQEKPSAAKRRKSVDLPSHPVVSRETADPTNPTAESAVMAAAAPKDDHERQSDYDNRLTHGIWQLATTNANPAVDLLICLERRQPIGFRYVDITRSVVIHHGSRDTRVPVDNVRWLSKTMRRCEARILEGEGHGLMASAAVMGDVLMEIAKEWDDWTTIVQGKGRRGTNSQR